MSIAKARPKMFWPTTADAKTRSRSAGLLSRSITGQQPGSSWLRPSPGFCCFVAPERAALVKDHTEYAMGPTRNTAIRATAGNSRPIRFPVWRAMREISVSRRPPGRSTRSPHEPRSTCYFAASMFFSRRRSSPGLSYRPAACSGVCSLVTTDSVAV